MADKVQALRSSIAGARPAGRSPGELYVNFADHAFGYIDAAGVPQDLGGGPPLAIGDAPPAGPRVGDMWYKTSIPVGVYAWVDDGTSTQWVEIAGFLKPPAADPAEAVSGTTLTKLMTPLTTRIVLDAEKLLVPHALRNAQVSTAVSAIHAHADRITISLSRIHLASGDTLSLHLEPIPAPPTVPSSQRPRVGFEVGKLDVVGGAATVTAAAKSDDLLLITAGAAGDVSGTIRMDHVSNDGKSGQGGSIWTVEGNILGPGGHYTRFTGHYENNGETLTEVHLLSSRTAFDSTYKQEFHTRSER